MEHKLRALVNAAGAEQHSSDRAVLLAKLSASISSTRQMAALLKSEDAAGAFASQHKLSAPQRAMLKSMASRQKRIYKPMPWLDHALTAAFILEIFLVGWAMQRRDIFWLFILLLLVVGSVIARVKEFAAVGGAALSSGLQRFGLVEGNPLAAPLQMKKWTEQSWQLVVHGVAAITELYILSHEGKPWWDYTEGCWIPQPSEQKPSTLMQVYYLTQMAVWIYTCIIHRFVDERRKDYFVMYIHHVMTIALVGISWANGYLRIGLLVLYVHDISDVFVDSLKMINYLKLEGRKGFFASEIAYVTCLGAWMYWRLWVYPFHIIGDSAVGAFDSPGIRLEPRGQGGLKTIGDILGLGSTFWHYETAEMPGYTFGVMLLGGLQVLHAWWFYLLCMVGYRILTASAREASRQEYEGDSDAEDDGEDDVTPPDSTSISPEGSEDSD